MARNLLIFGALALTLGAHAQAVLIAPDTMLAVYMGHAGDRMLFFHKTAGGHKLWGCDGTAPGTHLVKDINPMSEDDVLTPNSCGPDPYRTFTYNDEFYFLADDGSHGVELWKSDGTDAGTSLLKDIGQPPLNGQDFSHCNYPSFCESNGILYFEASTSDVYDFELWRSDGTTAGTVQVKDIYPGAGHGSDPHFMTDYNNKVYFTANDSVHGLEVFVSDGTSAGTHVLKDIMPGTAGALDDGYGGSFNPHFTVAGNYLFFLANNDVLPPGQAHLWRTDGTEAGTIQLETTLQPALYATQYNDFYAGVNGDLLFQAGGGTSPSTLFKSDGTPAGTQEVVTTDIEASAEYHEYNNLLYFQGSDGSQNGLYKSDGTTAGTGLVRSFTTGQSGLTMRYFINFAGSMFFQMQRYTGNGTQWRIVQSNGADNNTVVVPGVQPNSPLIPVGNELLFYGTDSTNSGNAIYALQPYTLGVEQLHLADQMAVYPNPASSTIVFGIPGHATTAVEADLIDGMGRVVNSTHVYVDGSPVGKLEIPPGLADGMYELRVRSDDGRIACSEVMVAHER